jgi:hypothetical protein
MRRINCAETPKKCARFLPADPLAADQLEVRLVHERRGLKRVAGPFPSQVTLRQPAQLAVNERHQLFARHPIPVAPGLEELRDLMG